MTALKLLIKGVSLVCAADAMDIKFDTVRRRLKTAAKQKGTIYALFIKKLKFSQTDLDILWAYISENSLHQRASFIKGEKYRWGF